MIQKINALKNWMVIDSNEEELKISKENTRQIYADMAVIYGFKNKHEQTSKLVRFTNQNVKYASMYSIYGLTDPRATMKSSTRKER